MKVLVLGAAGLLGNAMFRVLSERQEWQVHGTVRAAAARSFFVPELAARLATVTDLTDQAELERLLAATAPDVVVNCVAPGKQTFGSLEKALGPFALFPRRLAVLCATAGARLVHISSDGVFSGKRGGYTEADCPDAADPYGVAKFLGEPSGGHTVTIRTSMLGPELGTRHGLLEWFLAQDGSCRGFTRAIFSGLPTVALAAIVRDLVIPRPALSGIYHVASQPISKYGLLELVASEYGKPIELVPDDSVAIDRSLIAERFRAETGYTPPGWPELVRTMRAHRFGLVRS
jgi:dTDP-4-dehydrorhamnose reductase